jgi:hypothetical protein
VEGSCRQLTRRGYPLLVVFCHLGVERGKGIIDNEHTFYARPPSLVLSKVVLWAIY